MDIGAGAGLDALIAARAVGPAGHVIGVDMTEAMLGLPSDRGETGRVTWATVQTSSGPAESSSNSREVLYDPLGERQPC